MLFETETFVGKANIFLNGKRLDERAFEAKTVYDFKNLEADVSEVIKTGKNVLRIVFDEATDASGIIGEIYFY